VLVRNLSSEQLSLSEGNRRGSMDELRDWADEKGKIWQRYVDGFSDVMR
jgi:hypothetical protein